MYSQVISAAICGINAQKITIETDIANGLPITNFIGYLSSEVKEAQERVRTALKNIGQPLPVKRITVNLAPADLRKEGSGYDLPIAISILVASEIIAQEKTRGILFVGELGLDGRIEPVRGVIEMVSRAPSFGCHTCIIPRANLNEGSVVSTVQDVRVLGAERLSQVVAFFSDGTALETAKVDIGQIRESQEAQSGKDFSQVHGQRALRRAAEVAVAGGHNLLIIGPPGSGKTMTAQRIPTILPPTTVEEALEITRIHSIAGTLPDDRGLMTMHPFRAPHHTISPIGMAGGGKSPRPGEISLAHKGVLYLDELPEFKTETLEILRQPLEDQQIVISRNFGHYTFPTDLQLIASMNPCKCGYYPDRRRCRCTPFDVKRYLSHISQPLLDRIDICVEASEMTFTELSADRAPDSETDRPESSAQIRERVIRARQIQRMRYDGEAFDSNARLTSAGVEKYCPLGAQERSLMERIYRKMKLTARAYLKMLKVARTISDLEGGGQITGAHLTEAAGYRMIDRKYWNDGSGV